MNACATLAAFLAALVLAGCTVVPGATARLPLRGEEERDLRRADALGLTPTASLSMLPLIESDFAWTLAESGETTGARTDFAPSGASSVGSTVAADLEWFGRFSEREAPHVEDVVDPLARDETFFAPADDARLRYVWVDGTVRFENENGREFSRGSNLYASNRAVLRVADLFVLAVTPVLSFVENRNDLSDDSDFGFELEEVAATARAGPVEVTVGRGPLWWGPGRHGSLLLTNNAEPLDHVRISTADRLLLPGFLAYLGLLRAEIFLARLEGARPIANPLLAGARLSTRLLPWIEFGASRTAMFGGKGRSVSAQTILDVITARGENTPEGPGDQKASLDARIILPFSWQPIEIYGEYGGEDEAGGFFSNVAYVAGLYLPRIGPLEWLELSFELADTSLSGERNTWYVSDDYLAGYTHEGNIIGHHAGPDAFDLWLSLVVHLDPSLRMEVSYDFEEHRKLDPVTERLHQFRVTVTKTVREHLDLSVFVGYDRWRNFRQVFGDDETGAAVGCALHWYF
ncbi:MAG TPA: capsule assembly Wzi family protein [Planctomycetota bacterium]|nr:capsule assembly Wzi family protein [Planctomycetota bacterium]